MPGSPERRGRSRSSQSDWDHLLFLQKVLRVSLRVLAVSLSGTGPQAYSLHRPSWNILVFSS